MYTVATFNVLVVLLAHRAGKLASARWLKIAFGLVFLFLALRYDYGNDYANYLAQFAELDELDLSMRVEPGWQVLCLLFKPLGFFAMVAALSAFNCWAFYTFIRRYVPPPHYGFATFLYVFNPYFMLVHLSAMRQSIAISLFLFAIRFVENRSPLRFLLCVAAAASFHVSAVVLLPTYLLSWRAGRMRLGVGALVLALYAVTLLFIHELRTIVEGLVGTYASRYNIYSGGVELGSGLGLVYGVGVLGVIVFAASRQTDTSAVLSWVAIVSYFATIPLAMINQWAGRIGMYFAPAMLAVIPNAARAFKDRKLGGLFLVAYACMTLFSFYTFFDSDVWRIGFGTYKTILSAPAWP